LQEIYQYGTYHHNNGTILFTGNTTILGSSENSFNHITISGILTAPAGNINIAGDFVNNGTFNDNSGTITFNGTTNIPVQLPPVLITSYFRYADSFSREY